MSGANIYIRNIHGVYRVAGSYKAKLRLKKGPNL